MMFVDSNIPMYLIGKPHPNKGRSEQLLQAAVASGERLVTDVEVFQEIMHRYDALRQRQWIQPAFAALLGVVDEVFPIEWADVEGAKSILLAAAELSARDALHLAVMERGRISRILSFDSGFDAYAGVQRLA